jgi:uncharacterized membrane protein
MTWEVWQVRADRFDLPIVSGLALVLVVLTLAPSSPVTDVLRVIAGIPTVLFAPGFALVAVIWPRSGLRTGERLALSIGMSLCVCVLGGLVLYLLGVRLQALAWSTLLGVVTVGGSLGATVRRARQPRTETPTAGMGWPLPSVALSAAALALTVIAFGIAAGGAAQQRERFSELWLVQSDQVEVGLRSMELQPTRYRLQVLDGDRVALDVNNIQLANGETWQTSLPLGPSLSNGDAIQALLFRADSPDAPYRQAILRPPRKG